MIKTVIFDIGNVLVEFNWKNYLNSFPYSNSIKETLANAIFLSPEWNELDRGVLTSDELLNAFIKNAPEYHKEIKAVFKSVGKCIHQFDYAIPLIQTLKKSHLKVYVLSNYGEYMYQQTLDELNFLQYTDGGILSYQDKVIKPDPLIYKLLLQRYDIEPASAVFLDDTISNVETAIALGINGIHFTSYKNALEELEKFGIIVH